MAAMTALSRSKICRKFKITDRTLTRLERSGLLSLAWSSENGQLVSAVSDSDTRLLSVAPMAIESFRVNEPEITRWPFHRFLTLRFLQVQTEDLEDLLAELIQRNLVAESVFTIKTLRSLHEVFLKKLPPQLRFLSKSKREPVTDEEKEFFSYLLDVLEIRASYEHPGYEQGFEFMLDEPVKDIVDAALTTKSDYPTIRKFLTDAVALHIVNEGLALYQLLFHDINALSAEEVRLFLKNSKPSQRARLITALGQTIETFRVRSGIEETLKADQTLEFLRDRVIENLIRAVDIKTEESEKSFLQNLRGLMLITERLDQLRPEADIGQSAVLPPYMRQLRLESVSIQDSGLFQLPAPKAEEKHG